MTPSRENRINDLRFRPRIVGQTPADRDLPPFNGHHFQSDNLVVSQPKEGIPCHAERKNWRQQITPELREVEVEVGRGKTVAEAVKKIGVTEQTYS